MPDDHNPLIPVDGRCGPHSANKLREWSFFLCLFALLLLAGLLTLNWDTAIVSKTGGFSKISGDLRRIFSITEMVAHGTGVAVILLVIWHLVPRNRLHLPRLAACAFCSGLVASGCKLLVARARPISLPNRGAHASETWFGWFPNFNNDLQSQYDYALQSFPSAHTATAIGFAVGLIWLYPRGKPVFIALALMAGLQRILSAAHWPSDVLFGAAIGVFMGGCFVLPGTLGCRCFDYLEWRTGLGRELRKLSVTRVDSIESQKAA